MRKIVLVLIAAGFVSPAGCGCLGTWEDRNLTRYGGGGPDPDQSAWHKCLFGTRYLPGRPYGPNSIPPPTPNAIE